MSSVTVVPAAAAAAQIRAMFSRAVFSPCSGRSRPTAVGLTETSARPPPPPPPPPRPRGGGEPLQQPHVLVGHGGGLLRVDRVLAQVVEGHQQAVGQQPAGRGPRGLGGGARPQPRPRAT